MKIDEALLPYIRAANPEDVEQALQELISGHADPIIRPIIRAKLRTGFRAATGGDIAEDVYSEVMVRLLRRLRSVKREPAMNGIENLSGYIATLATRCCYQHLREKYPERWRLKNRVRYVLNHKPGIALWKTASGTWLCGRQELRDRTEAVPAGETPHESEPDRSLLKALNPGQRNLQEIIRCILDRAHRPLELDRLVSLVAEFCGLRETRPRTGRGGEGEEDLLSQIPDTRTDPATAVERRGYLERLWNEICRLELRQRAALLLNLRDSRGNNAVMFFPIAGIAGIRQIAKALEMEAQVMAELWNDLPLEDKIIAERLGLTRQQIINLRKSARARLARQMSAYAGSKARPAM